MNSEESSPPPGAAGEQEPESQAPSQNPPAAEEEGAAALPSPSTPAEVSQRNKLIRQQLVILLHAHKCQWREERANGTKAPCTLPYCKTMRDVLTHMTTCETRRNCPFTHCSSSRQIIGHWQHCIKTGCPVCEPLQDVHDNMIKRRQCDCNEYGT